MADLSLERGLEVLESRRIIVTWTIYIFIALSVAMVFVSIGEMTDLVSFDGAELDTLSAISSIGIIAYIVVFIASVVIISMWIYRGHANLRAAGIEGLEFSPGWSVGWFFIPVACLFKPFQAMKELWTVSHAQSDSFGKTAPTELTAWWGCYIAGTMLSNMSQRMSLGEGTSHVLDTLGSLAIIASAWMLLRIVQSVTRAQNDTLAAGHVFA